MRPGRASWLIGFGVLAAACGEPGRGDGESATAGTTTGITAAASITVTITAAGTEPTTSGGSEGGTGPKYDLPAYESDGGDVDCVDDEDQDGKFSIIWIANSAEGTVSKIDTVTATELARYRTGPGAPDPSRTSVNLLGDVAVANRAGGVTKIAARLKDCVDSDGDGVITTSQGPGDILPWGEDECVLWHHPVDFPQGLDSNQGGPRGIAWDAGSLSSCFGDAHVWIGWRDQPNTGIKIRRLDGATGIADATIDVPDWMCNWGHGPYGAAADKDGAYWGLGTLLTLVRIDPKTLAVERFQGPGGRVVYGIAIDAAGNPWLAGWDGSLWRFEVESSSFHDMGGFPGGPQRLRGLAIDSQGHAWVAGNDPCALARYDTTTHAVVNANIALPGCGEPVGVSIDRDEFVWVVDRAAGRAYKVNPVDYSSVTVEGLVAPYTYSDMTGRGLDLVVNPPTK